MGVHVTLYGFRKKINSTARPSGAAVFGSYDCEIRQGCSIKNPVILVKTSLAPSGVNYAYISDYRSYYWVDDAVWQGGLWAISAHIDPLATYQNEIRQYQGYILRAADQYDNDIIDTMIPSKRCWARNIPLDTPFATNIPSGGSYVLGVINNQASGIGCVTYYTLTQSQFNALKAYLLSDEFLESMSIEQLGPSVSKMILNPYQYIVSCIWLPVQITPGAYTQISVGWWTLPNIYGNKIISANVTWHQQISFQVPDLEVDSGGVPIDGFNYRPPYCTCILHFPPFGNIPIDTSIWSRGMPVFIDFDLDYISGICTITVIINTAIVYQSSTMAGVQIQLAQMGVDYLHAASTPINTAGNIVSSVMRLDIGGAISAATSGVQSTVKSSMPQLASSGENGSFAAYKIAPSVTIKHYTVDSDAIEQMGRPLCKFDTLGNHRGFLMIASPDPKISANSDEQQQIREAMASGFYLED